MNIDNFGKTLQRILPKMLTLEILYKIPLVETREKM